MVHILYSVIPHILCILLFLSFLADDVQVDCPRFEQWGLPEYECCQQKGCKILQDGQLVLHTCGNAWFSALHANEHTPPLPLSTSHPSCHCSSPMHVHMYTY